MVPKIVYLLVILVIFSVAVEGTRRRKADTSDRAAESKREGRLFSLFNIVQFKDDECTSVSDSNVRGSCFTSSECSMRGGRPNGNCAAGFGVCCVIIKSACNDNVDRNLTYIQHPEFPGAATFTGFCRFNFNRIENDICQLRLDFESLRAVGPGARGQCGFGGTSDTVTVTSPTGSNPPVVCGTLTGQHMYLDTGTTGTAGSIEFNIGTDVATRAFRVKVTYYECNSRNLAPTGCTQYFTGISGSFQSYNFQGAQIMNNLDYATCIRRETGFCGINYMESAQNGPDSFNLFGAIANNANAVLRISETTLCPQTYIEIPTSTQGARTGRFCGNTFSSMNMADIPGIVQSTAPQFSVLTFTAGNLNVGAGGVLTAAPVVIAGYSLDYAQTPC